MIDIVRGLITAWAAARRRGVMAGLPVVVLLVLAGLTGMPAPAAADDAAPTVAAEAPGAARLNDGIAAWNAGDYETAATILKPLADAGDPRFQEWFVEIHADSLGDAPSGPKTIQYLKFAAAIGDPNAQASLGVRYLNGVGGVNKDENKGVFLLQQAANQDITLAILALGSYFNPYGHAREQRENQDFKKSSYFFARVARMGEPKAQLLLGSMTYLEGLKMSPDTPQRGDFLAYGLMWVRVADLGGEIDKAGAFFRAQIDFFRSEMNMALFTAFRAGIEFRAQKCLKSKFQNCGTAPVSGS